MAAMARGPKVGRITGFRCDEPEAQVTQRTSALGAFLTGRAEIERALRDARRAGRTGAAHYDPARHAALLRMLRRFGAHTDSTLTPEASAAP